MISISAGSSIGIRQYTINATGLELTVTGLAEGLSYNAALERIEADAEGAPASSVATFTIIVPDGENVVDTTTVALVEFGDYPEQGPIAGVPALRNRRGFAMTTRHAFTGGDPSILRVTNTNRTGTGSFAAAYQASGNRIIVFETSGAINFEGTRIAPGSGNCWVAGQSAPAPGITIYNGGLRFGSGNANVLIQHVRVYMTGGFVTSGGSVQVANPIAVGHAPSLIFDHCEAMFSLDELVSVGGTASVLNVDFIDSIFAYPIDAQPFGHDTAHRFGPIFWPRGLADGKISVQGCFLAHIAARGPLSSAQRMLWANNLNYNFENRHSHIRKESGQAPSLMNFIGNRYRSGNNGNPTPIIPNPASSSTTFGDDGSGNYDGVSKLYIADNARNGVIPSDQWSGTILSSSTAHAAAIKSETPISEAIPDGFVPWANVQEMEDYILNHAGAFPNTARSAQAQHAIDSYINGTGALLGPISDLGAAEPNFATIPENSRAWETLYDSGEHGPEMDNHGTESGRKNVEVFLLDLAQSV